MSLERCDWRDAFVERKQNKQRETMEIMFKDQKKVLKFIEKGSQKGV